MYLRFETELIDKDSRRRQGIFIASHRVLDEQDLPKYDYTRVRMVLDWFNKNLYGPKCLKNREANKRARSWFKASAFDVIAMAWELVAFLKEHDVHVRVVSKRELGQIIYEDRHQVVAFPKRGSKS
jgi:hypothetical protein